MSPTAHMLKRLLSPSPFRSATDPWVMRAVFAAAQRRHAHPGADAFDAAYLTSGAPRPLLLGHRGAMARAPENTLGSFQAALDDGADGVELDVQLSADAVPVVLHDDTLDRTSDARGAPIRMDARSLDAVDAGSWFSGWSRREKIPRLAEVFLRMPKGSVVNVELKGPTPLSFGLERQVLRCIADHAQHLFIIVSSFHPAQLLAVKKMQPQLPTALLLSEHSVLPLRTGFALPLLQPLAVHPPSALVDSDFVAYAHRAGMRVHVWGVRDDDDARRLLDLGVDGLIVDDVRATAALMHRTATAKG